MASKNMRGSPAGGTPVGTPRPAAVAASVRELQAAEAAGRLMATLRPPGGSPAPPSLAAAAPAAAAATAKAAPAGPTQITGLPGRQELAIRRFTQYCSNPKQWGLILFHTVGTGKTIVSMLTALNSIDDLSDPSTRIIIIAPPGIYEERFMADFEKLGGWAAQKDRFVSYPIDRLTADLNRKSMSMDLTNAIVIVDEAHRLLHKNIMDSMEAGPNKVFHPIITDAYFKTVIYKAKRCIIMTGTPVQTDLSDVCKLLNFVSKTDKFSLATYAPITVSITLQKNIWTISKALLNSPDLVKSAFGLGGTAATAILGKYGDQLGRYVPALPAIPKMISENWYLVCIIFLISILIRGLQRGEYKLSKRQVGINVATFAVTSLTVTQASSALKNLTDFPIVSQIANTGAGAILGPTSNKSLQQLLTSPLIDTINEAIDTLNEPLWDPVKLARDASEYISIYDPIIQKEFTTEDTGSFTKAKFTSYITNPSSFSAKIGEVEGELSDFPVKTMIEHTIRYDEFQLNILQQMYIGEVNPEIQGVLNLEMFKAPSADIASRYKEIRKYGRMIGNLSRDVIRYFVGVSADGNKYVVFQRSEITEPMPSPLPPLFACNKFNFILDKLLKMRQTGQMEKMVTNAEGVQRVELTDQPHLCEERDIYRSPELPVNYNKQYLPLVYSYTEDYGTALFAAFLETHGYKYILLHPNQDGPTLLENLRIGKNVTYGKMTDRTQPLCVILHPTFTEGYDFKHNPAIFTIDPCNTVGDQLQVHGRIFRRYNSPLPRKEKTVNEFVCIHPEEQTIWRGFLEKYHAAIEKRRRSQVILTPTAIFEVFKIYKFISPDIWSSRRLKKESTNLDTFELSVYGGTSGDIVASDYCITHEKNPIPECDPLDGQGCRPDDSPLANNAYQTGIEGVTEFIPSKASQTWDHVIGRLRTSGLDTKKVRGGRRTLRRNKRTKMTKSRRN